MPASIIPLSCSLQMRRRVGVDPDTSRDKLASLTFDGIDEQAEATTLLGISDAINAVITTPIVSVYRNDKNVVDPGE